MPHHHLCFQSLYSLQSNTDHDDNRSTADGQILNTGHQVAGNNGQQSDHTQVNGTEDNDLVNDLLNELSGGLAGTEAGDETAVLLQLVLLPDSVRSCGDLQQPEEQRRLYPRLPPR